MHRRIQDLQLWERDLDRHLHVVDRQRIRIGLQIEPGGLLIADGALDEDPVLADSVGAHPVFAFVEDR